MKKCFLFIVMLVLLLLIGCKNQSSSSNPDNSKDSDDTIVEDVNQNDLVNKPTENPNGSGKNTIIIYFSCTNQTKGIANKIVKQLGCDQFEIVPSVPYSDADLNYSDNSCRANREQNDETARPKIANSLNNLEQYDTCLIGYPIWWSKLPKILYTFFDTYSFENKTIIPFCTSGGSGIGESVKEIKKLEPKATIKEGKRFSGSASQNEIKEWLEGLDLEMEQNKMNIYINNHKLEVLLVDNSSTKALLEKLKQSDIILSMDDYGGFEKVGTLDFELPRNDESITTTYGDVILYLGKQITIYYDTNTWNFTRLGKVQNVTQEELKEILGDSPFSARFSIH